MIAYQVLPRFGIREGFKTFECVGSNSWVWRANWSQSRAIGLMTQIWSWVRSEDGTRSVNFSWVHLSSSDVRCAMIFFLLAVLVSGNVDCSGMPRGLYWNTTWVKWSLVGQLRWLVLAWSCWKMAWKLKVGGDVAPISGNYSGKCGW